MAQIVFDTGIFITYKKKVKSTGNFFSTVAAQELIFGAEKKSGISAIKDLCQKMEAADRLLVPTAEEWVEAGRILNSLRLQMKSGNKGKTPKLSEEKINEMVRDALIARTVNRVQATLVTDNVADFNLIRRFCKISVISGKEYFSD